MSSILADLESPEPLGTITKNKNKSYTSNLIVNDQEMLVLDNISDYLLNPNMIKTIKMV